MNINEYLNLIPPMNREKSRFIQFLSAVLSQVSDLDDLRTDMITAFDLDSAAGSQLDILGRLAGVSRLLPFESSTGTRSLADTDFRFLIRARILQDHWDGTPAGLGVIQRALFPGSGMTVYDYPNMIYEITAPSSLSTLRKEMLEAGLLLPTAPGVQLIVAYA